MSVIPKSLELYNQELAELHFSNKFVVFLCGPTLRDLVQPKVIRDISNVGQFIEGIRIYYSNWYTKLRFKALGKPGARLRKKLKDILEEKGFEVILGEDDGLEEPRLQYGMDAQENEMSFIKKHCNAIVLIASSIGAYCELGLFSYYKIHYTDKLDFILIISDEHKGKKSYLNLGPATAVEHWGKVYYEDLEKFDVSNVVKRLKQRRAVWWMDGRGRPKREK